jgi:hypothetical protein
MNVPRRGVPDCFASGRISHVASQLDVQTRTYGSSSLLCVGCPGEDLNLHELLHTVLSRARLPIPPPGLACIIA